MTRTRWLMLLLVAHCGDDSDARDATEEVISCEPCIDGDPCTDDRCDPFTGACVYVPRDPDRACRLDSHCSTTLPCMAARCAVDECGLQRCIEEPEPGCESCRRNEDCDDDDGCTVDLCLAEACTSRLWESCDARCSAAEALSAGQEQRFGILYAPLCGCPCEGMPTLQTDVENVTLAFDDPDAGCHVGCDVATCAPMLAGEHYVVYGVPGLDAFAVDGFCMDPTALNIDRPWQGRLTFMGQRELSVLLTVDPQGIPRLDVETCPECPLGLVSSAVSWGPNEGHARTLRLAVSHGGGDGVIVIADLFPSQSGFDGPLHLLTDSAGTPEVSGTIRLWPAN